MYVNLAEFVGREEKPSPKKRRLYTILEGATGSIGMVAFQIHLIV
jgi:hypothetical protein